MAVSLLQSISTATITSLPTISAGSDRVVVIVHTAYNGGTDTKPPSTMTVNGVSAVWIAGDATSSTSPKVSVSLWAFLETDIATISGQAISTSGATGTIFRMFSFTLEGCRQNFPAITGMFRSSAVSSLSIPITRVANSYSVGITYNQFSGSTTLTNPTQNSTPTISHGALTVGLSTDSARTANFTSTANNTYNISAVIVNFEPVPSVVINTINGSAFGAVKAASTGNTVTATSSFTPTSGAHGGKAISAIAGSSGSYTFTAPAYADGATYPEPDTSQTFSLADGTDTPNAASVLSSPNGMASVVLVSPNSADPTYPAYYFTMTADDRLVYPTEGGDFTIGTDSGVSTTTAGTRTCWHWNHTTSVMTQLNITVNDAGDVTGVTGLTSAGLTNSGLTSAGLTSSGL